MLSRQRLAQLARAFGIEAVASASRDALLTAFAERLRGAPDAKLLALLERIRRHQ